MKFVFSTQAIPFQYRAEPVARPFARLPAIVSHFVVDPVVDRN
jgi:hypothetical protein